MVTRHFSYFSATHIPLLTLISVIALRRKVLRCANAFSVYTNTHTYINICDMWRLNCLSSMLASDTGTSFFLCILPLAVCLQKVHTLGWYLNLKKVLKLKIVFYWKASYILLLLRFVAQINTIEAYCNDLKVYISSYER